MKRPPGASPDVPLRVLLRRYRYMLTLTAFVLLFLVPLLAWRSVAAGDCQARGGQYVAAWPWGYECVQAIPR